MCTWNAAYPSADKNRTTIKAECLRRPRWLATQELGPNASVIAKSDLVQIQYDIKCDAHNMSTAEGIAACRADRENGCYPTLFGQFCRTMKHLKVVADGVCPGTAFQQYSLCISKYVEECGAGNSTGGNTTAPDADGCVWAPLVYYRGLDSYNRYLAQNEESMGGPVTHGACFPKAMADAIVDVNGTYNGTKASGWGAANLGDPKNETDFMLRRGNCSYARMAYKRQEYTARCKAFNTIPLASPLDPYLNTIDHDAIDACVSAGCTVKWVDGVLYRNMRFSYAPESYFICAPDPIIMNLKYNYDIATDGTVATSALMCASPALQNDEAACLAATV